MNDIKESLKNIIVSVRGYIPYLMFVTISFYAGSFLSLDSLFSLQYFNQEEKEASLDELESKLQIFVLVKNFDAASFQIDRLLGVNMRVIQPPIIPESVPQLPTSNPFRSL